jgi:hypothetical protein
MNNTNRIITVFLTLFAAGVIVSGCVTVSVPPPKTTVSPSTLPAATQAPVIKSFTADPAEIGIDDMATLKWEVSGVQNISIDQGIGEASSVGDRKVAPKVTTMYTLTATNAAGAVSSTVTVNVVGNVNARKIALTRDDVRFYGFTFSSDASPQVEDTVSAYTVNFVKGKETLTNMVYVYPTSGGGGAERKYYEIEPQYRQNNQNIYSIGEVRAYLMISKATTDEESDRFGMRFVKNNVWVHLGFISDYHGLETLAKMLVSRIR